MAGAGGEDVVGAEREAGAQPGRQAGGELDRGRHDQAGEELLGGGPARLDDDAERDDAGDHCAGRQPDPEPLAVVVVATDEAEAQRRLEPGPGATLTPACAGTELDRHGRGGDVLDHELDPAAQAVAGAERDQRGERAAVAHAAHVQAKPAVGRAQAVAAWAVAEPEGEARAEAVPELRREPDRAIVAAGPGAEPELDLAGREQPGVPGIAAIVVGARGRGHEAERQRGERRELARATADHAARYHDGADGDAVQHGMRPLLAGLAGLALLGCGSTPAAHTPAPPAEAKLDLTAPWVDPESFVPAGAEPAARALTDATRNPAAPTLAIVGGTVMTATGTVIERGTVVLAGGAIRAIGGADVAIPAGARVIDAHGRWVTPGIIDAHSHLGVYPAPASRGNDDGNEAVAPVTAGVRAEYGYWPDDPQIERALAGGVTAALILPGSANLIGGRGFTVAMRPGRIAAEVAFPGAPSTVKMACGENPKRVYGGKGGPQTRMGVYAGFRAAFAQATAYAQKQAAYADGRARWLARRARAAELDAAAVTAGTGGKPIAGEPGPEPPAVDLGLETLAGVLRGEVLVQIHCYKAADMAQMIAIADRYGFAIRSFHHALEAYKIRDLLAARGIAVNTWADWWGFKLEAEDGIPENAALITEQGGRVTIHSDSAIGIQRLNQEAAKAAAAGRRAGVALTDDQVLRWVTANPAWVLGIDAVTGTLEVGKRADVVVWSASPFSVYSKTQLVVVGGEVAFDRAVGLRPADLELGATAIDGAPPPPAAATGGGR